MAVSFQCMTKSTTIKKHKRSILIDIKRKKKTQISSEILKVAQEKDIITYRQTKLEISKISLEKCKTKANKVTSFKY